MLALCIANTALSVSVLIATYTEYHCGRTVDGDETKHLLVHCKRYHMNANLRQNIQADFVKTFRLKFSSGIPYYMVDFTKVD